MKVLTCIYYCLQGKGAHKAMIEKHLNHRTSRGMNGHSTYLITLQCSEKNLSVYMYSVKQESSNACY